VLDVGCWVGDAECSNDGKSLAKMVGGWVGSCEVLG